MQYVASSNNSCIQNPMITLHTTLSPTDNPRLQKCVTNGGFHITAREKYPCTTFGMTMGVGHNLNILKVTRMVKIKKMC